MKKNLYFFIGTTAELIKLAPIIKNLNEKKCGFKIIYSGQVDIRFNELESFMGEVKPDIAFPYRREKSSTFKFGIWFVKTFIYFLFNLKSGLAFGDNRDKYMIVHGDTVSSLIGAVIGKIYKLKIIHIESGLRSFNWFEPFPEEICRCLISHLANIHFCPNKWAKDNLRNTSGKKINTYGNTVYDSINLALTPKNKRKMKFVKGKKYFILVVHRQEHTLFNSKETAEVIRTITDYASNNLKCVFIMHKLTRDYLDRNPKLFKKLLENKNVILPPRIDYVSFLNLIDKSEFMATDGGSNQEECFYLGKPCLILRGKTERIEGLGSNAVLSKNNLSLVTLFVNNYSKYKKNRVVLKKSPSKIVSEYLTS